MRHNQFVIIRNLKIKKWKSKDQYHNDIDKDGEFQTLAGLNWFKLPPPPRKKTK